MLCPVRVEDERGIVALAVRPFAGRAVVGATGRHRRGVEGIHLRARGGGEGDVAAAVGRAAQAQRERLVVGAAVSPAEAGRGAALVYQLEPERLEGCRVELPAQGEIADRD